MREDEATSAARLPKPVEADPRAGTLAAHLLACSRPLWSGARVVAAEVSLAPELRDVLLAAERARRIVRGLEACGLALDAETRGQRLADERRANHRNVRVSRLLLVTDDGAERFYRQVERTMLRHEGRVLAMRLDVGAEALGQLLFGPGRPTRAVMLAHKEFVAAALLAALPQKGRHLATGLLDGEPSDSSRDEIVRGEDVVG